LNFDAVSNKSYTIKQRADFDSGTWSRWQDFAALTSNTSVAFPRQPQTHRFFSPGDPCLP
jgi:hypothetical protein